MTDKHISSHLNPGASLALASKPTGLRENSISYLTLFLLLTVLAAVFFESTRPPTINNNLIPHLDKIVHFLVFGTIAWLLVMVLSFRFSPSASHLTMVLTSFVLVVLLGLANEWVQSFTSGRFTELNDVLADMAGAALFLLVWVVLRNRFYGQEG